MGDVISLFEEVPPIDDFNAARSLTHVYEIRDQLARKPTLPVAPHQSHPDDCTRCHQRVASPRRIDDRPYCDWCSLVVTRDAAGLNDPDAPSASPPPSPEPTESTDSSTDNTEQEN